MADDHGRKSPQFDQDQYSTSKYSTGEPRFSGGVPFVGHQINVRDLARYLGPVSQRSAWNQFDEHGLLASLHRLPEENNWQFKRRIIDAFVHLANASYKGLIHGITRDLGLSLLYPITINPKRSLLTEKFFAPDPYIKFDGVWCYIYSDYKNGILDYKIDRYEKGGNYEFLVGLCDFLNSTTYFEASLEDWVTDDMRSMMILNQSNRGMVVREPISSTTRLHLAHRYVVNGSVSFYDAPAYVREVAYTYGGCSPALWDPNKRRYLRDCPAPTLTTSGQYSINYPEGIVQSYDIPEVGTSIRYEYTMFPFRPVASNVILHDLNDDNFRVKMFEQVGSELGVVHGVPTSLGREIINELLSVTPMYWGV